MTAWHIVTGEYPPAPGGVSDYTYAVAGGLAAAGDAVHVWCPSAASTPNQQPGVAVHPVAGSWTPADLHRVDREMDAIPGEKKLLLQWVPHAFGMKSLNVRFCRWMRRRAKSGDRLEIMVHEPGLAFRQGTLRHDVMAAIHRLMLTTLLGNAQRVWTAIPAWTERMRPWSLGRRDLSFCWLPVPSTLPIVDAPDAVRTFREAKLTTAGGVIIGHIGTYQPAIRRTLSELVPAVLTEIPEARIELLGRGSEAVAEDLRRQLGDRAARIGASGELDAAGLSQRLQACDVLVQPYPDGASTRRTTLMAALSHGVPVVTTVGRLSESFWRDSDAIATVSAGDVEGMARLVARLARDPQRRAAMAASARATYDARFDLRHVIHALRTGECAAC